MRRGWAVHALTWCGMLAACESPPPRADEPPTSGFDVVIDHNAARAQSDAQRQAWIVYGLARGAAYQNLRDARTNPSGDDFLIELRARETLAGFWREERTKGAAADPDLDRLVGFEDRGQLAEHVLASLAKPGWTIPAADLARIDFAALAELARDPIEAPMYAIAKPRAGPVWSAAPGSALPDPASLPPPPGGCIESMPELRRAMTAWQREADRLDGAPTAADDRAGFLGALANLPADSAQRAHGATWVAQRPFWLSFFAGFCSVELDRIADAERWLEQAVSMAPRDPSARMELTHVLVAQRKFDRADAILDDAIASSQDRCELARAWRRRGYIRFEQRRLDEAAAAYHRSLEFDPESAIARSELDLLQREITDNGGTPQWYAPPASNTSVTLCPPG